AASSAAALSPCVPSMGDGPEVRVLPELGRRDRSDPQGADREGSAERSGVANPSSRRTETGSEALPSRASGHETAKLSRPKRSDVNLAAVRGRPSFLPGEISPCA